MTEVVHIVGAGLSGLSAAVSLCSAGKKVVLYEQTAEAGGRCRSFYDPLLETVIDNGSHLILSGNHATQAYLKTIQSFETLTSPSVPGFSFFDLKGRKHWVLEMSRGRFPWWIFTEEKRIPQTNWWDYFSFWKLFFSKGRTVFELFGKDTPLYQYFWEPLVVAVLNTSPKEAAAELLLPLFRETLGLGRAASRPLLPKESLQKTFITPAVSWLKERGVDFHFGCQINGLELENGGVTALQGRRTSFSVRQNEGVILAVPAYVMPRLMPQLVVPNRFSPIVNVHFRVSYPVSDPFFIGVVGGISDWIFHVRDVISVTIGAAKEFLERDNTSLIKEVWQEVRAALSLRLPLEESPPKARIIREHHATFLASCAQISLRPAQKTSVENLFLAGEWTNTGLPTTIEGAVRSGHKAAALVLER